MRRVATIVLCLCILAGAILACGESTSNTGTSANNSTSSSVPTPTTAQHFKVGQAVKVGDTWNITVDSIKTSNGSDIYKPKAGSIYLSVTISMKNISAQEQNVSSLISFNLSDKDGQKYTETIYPDAGNSPDGKVEAGAPLKGVITYEVPATMKSFTFSFQADITSNGQTIWDLSV